MPKWRHHRALRLLPARSHRPLQQRRIRHLPLHLLEVRLRLAHRVLFLKLLLLLLLLSVRIEAHHRLHLIHEQRVHHHRINSLLLLIGILTRLHHLRVHHHHLHHLHLLHPSELSRIHLLRYLRQETGASSLSESRIACLRSLTVLVLLILYLTNIWRLIIRSVD